MAFRMARAVNRLSARTVDTLRDAGRHADGAGLYLHLDAGGSKRWVFVFQWAGARKEMGLGSRDLVSLAEARVARDEARKLVAAGKNPIEERRKSKAKSDNPTFGALAEKLLDDIEGGWRNEKHRKQWRSTLKTYAAPIWDDPLDTITTDDVIKCLRPIWKTKPETASRVRGRIERVLDAAKAKGLRRGENPAQWKGHLETLLAAPQKLSRGHHKALPYVDAPEFMKALRGHESGSARALEFTILTAARTGETLGATWAEIDADGKVWTVPGARMKAKKDHRVPLTDAALEALGKRQADDQFLFPGRTEGSPLSGMVMTMQLRRLRKEITVHGFRSTFRDWAGEETDYPREVIEAALAHTFGNKVELAYRRGDALEKRRLLMVDWARYLAPSDA
jgi:integrase